MVEPAEVGFKAGADIWKKFAQFGASEDACPQTGIEIGEGAVISVVDVIGLDFGDVMDVGDDDVAGVAVDEEGGEPHSPGPPLRLRRGGCQDGDNFRDGVEVAVGDVAGAQAGEVGEDGGERAGSSGRPVVHDDGGQAAVHGRAKLRQAVKRLGEEVGAAFGEGVGEEDRRGARRADEGAAEAVAEVPGERLEIGDWGLGICHS